VYVAGGVASGVKDTGNGNVMKMSDLYALSWISISRYVAYLDTMMLLSAHRLGGE